MPNRKYVRKSCTVAGKQSCKTQEHVLVKLTVVCSDRSADKKVAAVRALASLQGARQPGAGGTLESRLRRSWLRVDCPLNPGRTRLVRSCLAFRHVQIWESDMQPAGCNTASKSGDRYSVTAMEWCFSCIAMLCVPAFRHSRLMLASVGFGCCEAFVEVCQIGIGTFSMVTVYLVPDFLSRCWRTTLQGLRKKQSQRVTQGSGCRVLETLAACLLPCYFPARPSRPMQGLAKESCRRWRPRQGR